MKSVHVRLNEEMQTVLAEVSQLRDRIAAESGEQVPYLDDEQLILGYIALARETYSRFDPDADHETDPAMRLH